MDIKYAFQNFPEVLKENFEKYVEKKISKINKFVAKLPDDAVNCTIKSSYHQKHNAFVTAINLEILSNTYHAEEDSHDVFKTIDLIMDVLITQLKKKKEVRKDRKIKKTRKITKKESP